MKKKKTVFACVSCGYKTPRWLGRCPECGEYNSFTEEVEESGKKEASYRKFEKTGISPLKDIESSEEGRLKTGIREADRVFGGGIVNGSLSLIGGDPGVGKSTLALLIAQKTAEKNIKVIYASGEESAAQIKMRYDRLGVKSGNLYVMVETGVENISAAMEKEKPGLVIVDSIQTVYKEEIDSVAGSVAQVRESCAHLMYAAKKAGIPVIIIGHVTKEGMIAGPKMLEHMVDGVFYFEAEKNHVFRILRAAKNRFGSTNEIGIFEMTGKGVEEVENPSMMLLQGVKKEKTGSVVVPVMEGTRPFMLEIQALTSRRSFGMPQRTVTGIDYNRCLLIIAILEKKLNLHMENQDVFMNVAGGLKVFETGADLGIAAAIYSSFLEVPVPAKTVFTGELGLDGELRVSGFMSGRIKEAERLGFKRCVVPAPADIEKAGMEIIRLENLSDIKKVIS